MLADIRMIFLPEGAIAEEKIAIFTAVGDEEEVSIGLESQPLHIDVFETAIPFVFLVGLALNCLISTS